MLIRTLLLLVALCACAFAGDNLGFAPNINLPTVNNFGPGTTNTLQVNFDCYLNTNVPCLDLEKAFFQADPFIASARGSKRADITVEVRAWNLPPDLEQYEIRFKGEGDLPVFKLGGAPLQIRSTFSPQAKLQLLVAPLIQGMSVYHRIDSYKTNPDGTLVVTYKANDGSTGPPKKGDDTPYFVSVGAGFNLSEQGTTDISGYGYAAVGYDSKKWLVVGAGSASYRYVSENTDQGQISATAASAGGGFFVARSVAEHWSVMAFVRDKYDPVNNFANRAQAHTGIEYELIPFLESNDNAFTVSYIIGGNYENYVEPNIEGRTQQMLATHALTVYYVKHTKWADFSTAAAVASLVNDPTRFAVGGKASVRFYLTRALTVDISGNVGYKNNIVNAPANPDTSNPVWLLIGGASATEPLTYQVNMNIAYTWGANLLRQKDTRWQVTPDSLPVNF